MKTIIRRAGGSNPILEIGSEEKSDIVRVLRKSRDFRSETEVVLALLAN